MQNKHKALLAVLGCGVGLGIFTLSTSYSNLEAVMQEYRSTTDGSYIQKHQVVDKEIILGKAENPNQEQGAGGGSGTSIGNISEETESIIALDDASFWKLISDNRFSSYEEASAAWRANESSEKNFWNGQVTKVEVPRWVFGENNIKVSSTVTITVNKHLTKFWTDFMTDLYNLPEKYVITSAGGFAPRLKNNGSKNPGLSSHTFGTTLDINANEDGMGSYAAGYGTKGIPFASSKNLSEPTKSLVCTLDNSWFELMKTYELNWGGLWSTNSLDPMHFSIVGDGAKKREVNYTPRGTYR